MKKLNILFATMPMDGHFSPLTSLAVHLKGQGFDVRWYVGGSYGEKVKKLGLPHYPYTKAQYLNKENLDKLFPEASKIRGTAARIRFDINRVFLHPTPNFIEDLTAIYEEWPFDLIIHDVLFLGGSMIREILPVKSVAIGVSPLFESDSNLPPMGLGKVPARSWLGRMAQQVLSYLVQGILFKPCNDLHNKIRVQHGLAPTSDSLFDYAVRSADLYFQSGVPSFEYPRQRISPNVRFVGAMLPHTRGIKQHFEQADKALEAKRVVLVTQGTVEKDVEKILAPTLQAFADDPDTLVIATTGGSCTVELRQRFPQEHFIIEDFIDFHSVMSFANVYVTNGGYGGVMLGLQHNLPIVAAGVHEGKSEIAARVGYCGVGVNLKTEKPKPTQIRRAVNQVLNEVAYRQNVQKMSQEFSEYNTNELATQYIQDLVAKPLESIIATPSSLPAIG
ncbi:4'-demethylrebeccamycin synthase [Dyadobacter sp. CECT 9275]|uniref:4'-demethylrebeccamycin synthase n=1 Tax=Dyadobacter helix TaxID=2822344 RepID=A0A916JGF4_9BACT|nr:nucleotide disphospho-sugar-binding domain-containing protein [Dyadobacter sp. CECT 9275]CAG5010752.1 4'-demethylrebeccamycin synthase [Dyadobacter sp. CECT 9275]